MSVLAWCDRETTSMTGPSKGTHERGEKRGGRPLCLAGSLAPCLSYWVQRAFALDACACLVWFEPVFTYR